jgi:dipeptidyl aminopeptidase/acylaminoacyl peptidase
MMRVRACFVVGLFLMLFHGVAQERDASNDSKIPRSGRRFEVKDSIEMARFERDGARPVFSPDKKYFAVVTSRGLLASNEIESTLWIFVSEDVRELLDASGAAKPVVPKALVRIAAVPQRKFYDSYGPVITDVEWLPDSNGLLFLAQNPEGARQLQEVNLQSGAARVLTPEAYDVSRFEFSQAAIAYIAAPPLKTRPPGESINSTAWDVTGLAMNSILFPETMTRRIPNELWAVFDGENTRISDPDSGEPIQIPSSPPPSYGVLSLSRDGRVGVVLIRSKTIPTSWESYDPILPYLRINSKDSDRGAMSWPAQYAAVDLKTGKTKVLVDAPNGWALGSGDINQPVWSSDGKRLLLTDTYLPFEGVDEPERSKHLRLCTAAVKDLISDGISCVAFSTDKVPRRYLVCASFGSSDKEVILKFWNAPNITTEERYRSEGGQWYCVERKMGQGSMVAIRREVDESEADFTLAIKQDLNTPPALWATDRKTGHGRIIWNPNPQLASFDLGEASEFRWKDKGGYEWRGALVKPPDYIPGKRYPLVIQTHGFQESEFITDGAYTTAFAARPLASAGIVVLQMSTRRDHLATAQEAPDQMEGFASAIETLANEGFIDSNKVGIVGFSRTCYYVESALIRDPHRFAAATISDGVDESYMQFLLFGAGQPRNEELQIYGSAPFGDGLKGWTEHAPGFHLDRVETPVRIEAITRESILDEWEIYASLAKQGKPVDLIYLPGGQHILQKPLERLASQQGNVDWFRFWLKGEEDSDRSKFTQYALWRKLRQQSVAEKP